MLELATGPDRVHGNLPSSSVDYPKIHRLRMRAVRLHGAVLAIQTAAQEARQQLQAYLAATFSDPRYFREIRDAAMGNAPLEGAIADITARLEALPPTPEYVDSRLELSSMRGVLVDVQRKRWHAEAAEAELAIASAEHAAAARVAQSLERF